METIDVDFDGSTTQAFRVGAASVAVPGSVAGLAKAHELYGTVPWARLFEPAVDLARNGVELTPQQAYLHAILDVILSHTEPGRAVYSPNGERLVAGDRLVMRDFAGTLERLAEQGPGAFYGGSLGRQLSEYVRSEGGALTEQDLREYRVSWRRPIEAPFLGETFSSNPPPSSGGVLLAYGLRMLDRAGLGGDPGSAEAIERLAGVMKEQAAARGPGFARELFRGGLARRLCEEDRIEAATARILTGTTHISVLDADGNAASLTASIGSGSGVVVPGTGVHLNNMLGEYDLNPQGRGRLPGGRLTSMMAPSLVLHEGRPRLVVGSAGSVRLRGAILQIVVNAIGHQLSVEDAINAPRIHLDDQHVHCEGGHDPAVLDELERRGYDIVRWRRRNLYFGGAAAVEVRADGALAAAGDPRRGGHGIVVDG